MTGRPLQPIDAWNYLPSDDESEVELFRSAEVAALHIETAEALAPPFGQTHSDLLVVPVDDDRTVDYFDDEQPEEAGPFDPSADDHEPDLEELLESQHYAFSADPEPAN